jgi:hypothetical protein
MVILDAESNNAKKKEGKNHLSDYFNHYISFYGIYFYFLTGAPKTLSR